MLYLLTFSNYFFGFITIPYQTRILGPEYFGKIAFATAFVTYFQLILDFGFILSATAEVANNKNDNNKLSKIMTAVVVSKLFLSLFSIILLVFLFMFVPKLREDVLLHILFFVYVCINSMLPDYLYRGLENMKIITYRAVSIKLFFTVMIFILLKDKSQYYFIPLLNIIGALGSVLIVYVHVYKHLKIYFVKITPHYVWITIKKSSHYFFSRIAASIYDATNTVILGFIYPIGSTVGHFTSANKIVTTARGGFSPIADSLYPYMIKNKNFALIKKILAVSLPIITLICIVLAIYSEFVCTLLFGEEFIGAAPIFRLLLPLIVLALPNYILGFPVLTPLGLANYANISTIWGAIIQIIGLIILYLLGILTVYNICILTNLTELSVLSIRVWAIHNRRKLIL